MVCATVSVGNEYDVPNRSVRDVPQVLAVLASPGCACGTPSWTSIACRSALVIGTPADASLPRAASTGEPGISLGRMKFSVIAAHRVMTNSTTLRRTYLIPALPSAGIG